MGSEPAICSFPLTLDRAGGMHDDQSRDTEGGTRCPTPPAGGASSRLAFATDQSGTHVRHEHDRAWRFCGRMGVLFMRAALNTRSDALGPPLALKSQ
jgi:hypothetical protein